VGQDGKLSRRNLLKTSALGLAAVGLGDLSRSMAEWSTREALRQWKRRAVRFTDISDERSAFRRTCVQLRGALRVWRDWAGTSDYVVDSFSQP